MRKLIPPLAAFLAQRLATLLCGAIAGVDALRPAGWVRWDAAFYLDLAGGGYRPPFPCPPESHYPATAWCGNTGWFPGYPWLIWLVSEAGLALPAAALLASALAQAGCLVLLWRMLECDGRQWPALLFGAFFFGSIYSAAPFPISLCLLALLGCIHLCTQGRWGPAAACSALAAATYPPALFAFPALLVWAALRRDWRALLPAAGMLLGVAAVAVTLQLQAGDWRAFLLVQSKYRYSGNAAINLFDTLGAHLKPLVNSRYRDAKGLVTGLQTLSVLALVIALGARARRWWAEPRASLLLLYGAAVWAAPLAIGGQLSLHRSEALLLPAALLLPGLPRPLQIAFTAAAAGLFLPMGALFFKGALV